MGDTDEEKVWVLQSRNGDPAAFELLIRLHPHDSHVDISHGFSVGWTGDDLRQNI